MDLGHGSNLLVPEGSQFCEWCHALYALKAEVLCAECKLHWLDATDELLRNFTDLEVSPFRPPA